MMDLFGATAALGLYRMTPGTPLMAELEAMSQGLESLGNRLEELETAMDPERMNLTQLRLWADTMEIPRWAGLEEGELRRWVKAFWKGGGFTLEALRQALLDGEIFLELQEEDGQLFLRGVERHPLGALEGQRALLPAGDALPREGVRLLRLRRGHAQDGESGCLLGSPL